MVESFSGSVTSVFLLLAMASNSWRPEVRATDRTDPIVAQQIMEELGEFQNQFSDHEVHHVLPEIDLAVRKASVA